jgi:hypothetical protein
MANHSTLGVGMLFKTYCFIIYIENQYALAGWSAKLMEWGK